MYERMDWLFSKEDLFNTPSNRDNFDSSVEQRYRKEGVQFIRMLCDRRHTAMATACVLYHRFFMLKSFRQYPRWEIAIASLFLGGKVEETPKKAKDVFMHALDLLKEIGRHNVYTKLTNDKIYVYERILLQTIKFDLDLVHPYVFLLKLAKTVQGEKFIINQIVQMAWSFINDSLATPLCLIYPPELIAISVMYLAFKIKNEEMDERLRSKVTAPPDSWWIDYIRSSFPQSRDSYNQQYSASTKERRNSYICATIRDLYDQNLILQGKEDKDNKQETND